MQARFASTDTLSGVYAFVRENLVEQARSFYLFLTPPPKKIPDSAEQIKYTEVRAHGVVSESSLAGKLGSLDFVSG